MSIPLVIPVHPVTAHLWFLFNANDVELLTQIPNPLFPPACLIASVNHRNELKNMLEIVGYYVVVKQCQEIIFRTSNPVVLNWAFKFCALSSWRQKHRPRFMATTVSSPRLFDLVARAYKTSIEKKRKRILRRS